MAGNDGYINSILRPYVDQFSVKSPDWQSYVRFLVIPFGKYTIYVSPFLLIHLMFKIFHERNEQEKGIQSSSIKKKKTDLFMQKAKNPSTLPVFQIGV